jgi:hypothetical protein
MLKTAFLPLATASLLALAACGSQSNEPQVIDTNPDPLATQLANAGPVELPPAIKADKTMRCKDGSLVYVTFFQGDKQAVVRTEQNGPATVLKGEAGQALTADGGWSLTGSTSEIALTRPGKGALSCHA